VPEASKDIPTVSVHDAQLQSVLGEKVAAAIGNGIFQQEVATESGSLRFGVRPCGAGAEFFAVNPETGEEIEIREQAPKVFPSGLIVKLNEFRRLRPSPPIDRPGRRPDQNIDVSACRFGCADAGVANSILGRPILLRITGEAGELAVLPQLAPLEPEHVILIPCVDGKPVRFPHVDQLLTAKLIGDMFELSRSAEEWIFVFNSMHAGATVRHIHLQSLRVATGLPIEAAHTIQRKERAWIEDDRFPGGGLVFESAERSGAITAIERLQARKIPLNFLVTLGRGFLFPRHPEREIAKALPYSGFASMEMAGVVYVSSAEAFEKATEKTVRAALRETALDEAALLEILA